MEILKDWKIKKHIFSFFHFSIFPHHKGFSFLEMLIVIMVVSILFVAFRSSFQIKNKDILYSQACIETMYGQVNNFFQAGMTSKLQLSGSTTIFPDQYIISFNPTQQRIQLKYNEQGNEYTYSTIELTGSNIMYCSSNSYIIQLSWETYEIYINKWAQAISTLKYLHLSWTNSISTWWSIFLQCNTQWTWCKTMARFESDTRTISLKKQMCLSFSGNDCSEWDN